ncbi:MAG: exopolysaccharide biosynthesis protein [Bacteroidota bacterium]
MPNPTVTRPAEEPRFTPVSEVLRNILRDNPGVQTFSIDRIVSSIGDDDMESSLLMFSIPGILPIPSSTGLVTLPSGAMACQLIAGGRRLRLPRFVREKTISRRALAVAIHAVLPVLEAAETIVRPRWSWITRSIWRRAVGFLVLLLVIAIAFPLFGFNPYHAAAIFIISLGLAENDGLTVFIGVVAGVLSLILLAASVSLRAARSRFTRWLLKLSARLGLRVLAKYLDRLGHQTLAKIVRLRWSTLLMKWNPEGRSTGRAPGAADERGVVVRPIRGIRRQPATDRSQREAAAAASLSSALA